MFMYIIFFYIKIQNGGALHLLIINIPLFKNCIDFYTLKCFNNDLIREIRGPPHHLRETWSEFRQNFEITKVRIAK